MKRAMSIAAFLSAVFAVAPAIADAQAKVLPATDISAAQIQALLGPRKPGALPNIRVVDAGGHNVGVGVLYRAQGQTQVAAVHFKVSEVYHVIQGSGTLVTGGTVVNPKTRASDSAEVRQEDGPGVSGTAIEGGVSRQIKPGDVVVIQRGHAALVQQDRRIASLPRHPDRPQPVNRPAELARTRDGT